MSRKSVAFNMTPIRKPDPSPADVWVKERTPDLAEAGQGATVEVLEAQEPADHDPMRFGLVVLGHPRAITRAGLTFTRSDEALATTRSATFSP